MTFEKAFEAIKKKFADADAKDVRDFALQITLSDEDCGGTFYAAVRDGVLAVEPYDYKENDAVMDISKADFAALVSGRISLDKAVEKGASLKGDASVVDALKATLKKAPKKPAPKKAAEKTETPKTAPVKPAAEKTEAPKTAPAKKAPAAKKTAAKQSAVKKTTVKKTTK